MKFSIIVPSHNAQDTIERCALSLLRQNVADKEILLIDDHSEDKTAEICQRMAGEYREVRFLTSARRGASAARNVGLEYARGDIIGFCDSDDTYETYTLELVRNTFLSMNVEAVVGGVRRVKDLKAGFQTIRVCTLPSDRVCSFEDLMALIFTDDDAVMGSCWNKFFKRAMIESVRFNENLSHCEDMHFIFQILSRHQNSTCAVIAKPFYNYTVKADYHSVTRPKDMSSLFEKDGTLRYISSCQAIERDCPLTDRIQERLRDRKVLFAITELWNFRCFRGNAYEKQMTLVKSVFPAFLRSHSYHLSTKIKCMVKLALLRMFRIRATVLGQKLT